MRKDQFAYDLWEYRLAAHLVLDGARVMNLGGRDIEARIRAHDLFGRPLFRDTADREALLAGPWLIPLSLDREALDSGLAIADEIGKGIFWLGEPDTDVLFRHLRKLAAARLPDSRIVYFRYYDSDVLAAIAPLVNGEQAARIFGPAQVIGLVGGTGDGRTVEKPEDLPEPLPGPITIEAWQIDALDERQRLLSRQKIARVLRRKYAKQIGHLSEAELDNTVLAYEAEAESMNLTSEAAIGKWAILNIESGNGASRNSALKAHIAGFRPEDADEAFLQMIDDLRRSLRG